MKLKLISAVTAATMALVGVAQAAPVTFSEGQRLQVTGSTWINGFEGDAADNSPGEDLGTINGGQKINLHGRIVRDTDVYTFTSTKAFTINWIFDGYDTASGFEEASGFVAVRPINVPNPGVEGSTSAIFLNGVAAVGNDFSTDILNGDDPVIFGRTAAGTYEFMIDGLLKKDAYYDIQISAVPLPAGGLLLLTALGGLGIARRRRG